jgi:hypothetical protein
MQIKVNIPDLSPMRKSIENLGAKHKGGRADIGIVKDFHGVDRRSGKPKAISIAQEAIYNCRGVPTRNIPPRDYQALTIAQKGKAWQKYIKRQIAKGVSEKLLLTRIALIARQDTREMIESGKFAPNAPSTLARKGKKPPLIDFGDLAGGLQHRVIVGGKIIVDAKAKGSG